MSLYIGKNSAANSPLVITAGAHSINELTKVTLPSDTIFSTTIDFLTVKVFDLTSIQYTNNNYFNTVSGMLSNEAITYVSNALLKSSNNIPLIACAVNGNIITNIGRVYNADAYIWDFMDTPTLPNSGYVGHVRPYPTSTYKYKVVPWPKGVTVISMQLLVFSLDMLVSTNELVNASLPFDSSNSIIMNNGSIIVNNVNLSNLNYVTLKDVAATTKFTGNSVGATLSVTNTKSTNSLELVAHSNRVYIKNSSNEYLFDTNIGYIGYGGSIIANMAVAEGYDHTWYVTNFVAAPSNGAVILSYKFDHYYSYINDTKPVAMTNFYVFSTTKTVLYYLSVTASQTTYEYSISVGQVNGIYRLLCSIRLVVMGSDGNPGIPPDPFISSIGILS